MTDEEQSGVDMAVEANDAAVAETVVQQTKPPPPEQKQEAPVAAPDAGQQTPVEHAMWTEQDEKELADIERQLKELDAEQAEAAHAPVADTGQGWTDTPEMLGKYRRWLDGEEVGEGTLDGPFVDKFCMAAMSSKDPTAARKRFLAMFAKYDRTSKPVEGYDPSQDMWTGDAQKKLVREQWRVWKEAARGNEALASYINAEYSKALGMTEEEYAKAKADNPGEIVRRLVADGGFYDRRYSTADDVLGKFDRNTGEPFAIRVSSKNQPSWSDVATRIPDADMGPNPLGRQLTDSYGVEVAKPSTPEEKEEARRKQFALVDRFEKEAGRSRMAVEVYSAISLMHNMSDEARNAVMSYSVGRGGFANKGDVDGLISFHQQRFANARGDAAQEAAAMSELMATAQVLSVLDRRYGCANDGSIPNRVAAGVFNTMIETGDSGYSLVRGAGRLIRSGYTAITSMGESDEQKRIRMTNEYVRDLLVGVTEAEIGGENTAVGAVAGEVGALFGIPLGGSVLSPFRAGRMLGRVEKLAGKAMRAVSKRNGALYRAGSWMVRKGDRTFLLNRGVKTIKLANKTEVARGWRGKHFEKFHKEMLAAEREAQAVRGEISAARTAQAAQDAVAVGDYAGATRLGMSNSQAVMNGARDAQAMEALASRELRLRVAAADALNELQRGDPALLKMANALYEELPVIASFAANDYQRLKQGDAYQIGQKVGNLDEALAMVSEAEKYNLVDAAGRNVAFLAVPMCIRAAALGHLGGYAQQRAAKAWVDRLDAQLAAHDVEGAIATYRSLQMVAVARGPIARVGTGALSMGTSAAVGQAVENEKFEQTGLGQQGDVAGVFASGTAGGAMALGIMEAMLGGAGRLARRGQGKQAKEGIRERGAFLRSEIAMNAAAEHLGKSVDLSDLPKDPIRAKVALLSRIRAAIGPEAFAELSMQLDEGIKYMALDLAGDKDGARKYADWKEMARKSYGQEFVSRVEYAERELAYNPLTQAKVMRTRQYNDLLDTLYGAAEEGKLDENAVRNAFSRALGIGVSGVKIKGNKIRVRFGGMGWDGKPRHEAGSLQFEMGEVDPRIGGGKFKPRWAAETVGRLMAGEFGPMNGLAKTIELLAPERRAALENGEDVDGILTQIAEQTKLQGLFVKSGKGKLVEVGTGAVVINKLVKGKEVYVYAHETGHGALQALRDTGYLTESSGVEDKDGKVESGGKKYLSNEQLLERHVKEVFDGDPTAEADWEEKLIDAFFLGGYGSGSFADMNAAERAKAYVEKLTELSKKGVTGEAAKEQALAASFPKQKRGGVWSWLFGSDPEADPFSKNMQALVDEAKAQYRSSQEGRAVDAEAAARARTELRRRVDSAAEVSSRSATEKEERKKEKTSSPTPSPIEEKKAKKEETPITGSQGQGVVDEARARKDEGEQAKAEEGGEPQGPSAGEAQVPVDAQAQGTGEQPVEMPSQEASLNAPQGAPKAEGAAVPPESAASPQAGISASGGVVAQEVPAAPAEQAKSDVEFGMFSRAVDLIEAGQAVDAALLDGAAGDMLNEAMGGNASEVADTMRGLGYELDAENGMWVTEKGDSGAWHGAVADRAVKKMVGGEGLTDEERMHLGLIVDETGSPVGHVAVRRDGRIVDGEEISVVLPDGRPLPLGYEVRPFPANPSPSQLDAARRALGARERPEPAKPVQTVAKTEAGSVEMMSDGKCLITTKDEKGNERRRTLSAQHNIHAPYLLQALREGGFPMPSIGVTDSPLDFGESSGSRWTAIFGRGTVDPLADVRNYMYSADAWTIMDDKLMRAGAKNLQEVVDRMKAAAHGPLGRRMRNMFDALVERVGSIEEAHVLEAAGRLDGRDKERVKAEGERFTAALKEAMPSLADRGLLDSAVAEVLDAVQRMQEFGGVDTWGAIRDKLDELSAWSGRPPVDPDGLADALDAAADVMEDAVNSIREVGDKYFEAKPERVVGLDEIVALVAPWHYNHDRAANEQIEEQAKKLGIPVFRPKAKPMTAETVPSVKQRERGIQAKGSAIDLALDLTGARFLVKGVFTGTAADYANDSREGGRGDGPSLHKVGTGEGAQVYGWGLYGSTVRGVAESYMPLRNEGLGATHYEGVLKSIEGRGYDAARKRGVNMELIAEELDAVNGSVEALIESLSRYGKKYDADVSLDWVKSHRSELEKKVSSLGNYLYEQTFFTDRAPGDESHLLTWYEPISEENVNRVKSQLSKEGHDVYDEFWSSDLITGEKVAPSGNQVYAHLKRAYGMDPKSASEFLARADIDGVKYPVDSYGNDAVKDGNAVGWNYVSFRDDNIHVDHKWVDGVQKFLVTGSRGVRRWLGEERAEQLMRAAKKMYEAAAKAAKAEIREKYRGKPGARPNPTVSQIELNMPVTRMRNGKKGMPVIVHFAGDPNSGGMAKPRFEIPGRVVELEEATVDRLMKGEAVTVGDLVGKAGAWLKDAYPEIFSAPVKKSENQLGVVVEAKAALAGESKIPTQSVADMPVRTEVDTTRGRTRGVKAAATIKGGPAVDKVGERSADRQLGVEIFPERVKKGKRAVAELEHDLNAAIADLIASEEGWYEAGTFDANLAYELRSRWSTKNSMANPGKGIYDGDLYRVYALFGDPKLDANNPDSVLGKTINAFIDSLGKGGKKEDRAFRAQMLGEIRGAIADALGEAYKRFSNVVESRMWADRTGFSYEDLIDRGFEEVAEASEGTLFRGKHNTSEKASQRALEYWRNDVAKRVESLFKDMKGEFRRALDREVELERLRRAAAAFMRSDYPTKLRSEREYQHYLKMVEEENRARKKQGLEIIVPVGRDEALAYFEWCHSTGLTGERGRHRREEAAAKRRQLSLDKAVGDGTTTLGDMVPGSDRRDELLDDAVDAYESAGEGRGSETGGEEGSAEQAIDEGRGYETGSSQVVAVQRGATGSKRTVSAGRFDSVEAAVEEILYLREHESQHRALAAMNQILDQFPEESRMEITKKVISAIQMLSGGMKHLVTSKERGRRRRSIDELMAEAAGARLARARLRPTKGGVKVDPDAKVRDWLMSQARSVGVNEADRNAWCDAVMDEARAIASQVEATVGDKADDAAVIRAANSAALSRGVSGDILVGYALGSDVGMDGGASGERAKAMWNDKRRRIAKAARGITAAEVDSAIGSNWTKFIETLGQSGSPYADGNSLAAALVKEFSDRIRRKDPSYASMTNEELQGDVRVRAELARTVAGWLEHSAKELSWGDIRTDAERIAARLSGAAAGGNLSAIPTFREMHEIVMNHADRLAKWLDGRRAKDIIREMEKFIDEKAGASSRVNQQDRLEKRKADPAVQAYWTHVKKAIRMTAEAADKRLRKIEQELGTDRIGLEAEASESPEETVRRKHDLLMEAQALLKYGGLKDRKSGEIMDIYENEITPDLCGAAQAFADRQRVKVERQTKARAAFVKELTDFMREHGIDPTTGKGGGAATSFLMHNVPDLFRRLQMHLHEGSEAYEWVENFRREMSLGHLTAHQFVASWEAEMRAEFKACFGEDFEKKIGELQRKRDEFDRFSRTGWYVPDGAEKAVAPDGTHPLNAQSKLSLENLLYIRAACRQSDMARNNEVWGRDAAYFADLDATLRKELGPNYERFVNWLTDAYEKMREQLEPVSTEVTGMRVLSPAEEYCPLAFIQPSRTADTKRYSVNPFPSFLTRRVNHDLSRLDETQGACRMFEERLQQAGHYVGFARIADEVDGVLSAADVQTAYAQLLGKRAKNDVWSQLSDSLTGGRRDPGQLLNGVRNFVTASSLFGSFASSIKQLEGVGGWAAEMGVVPWLKGLVTRKWNSREVADACREIEAAGIFRTRGDEGLTEAMATLMDGLDGDAPKTRAGKAYKWYKRHGMDMTRLMDRIASKFMAGQYFVCRRKFYEGNGFSHDAATRAAIADVDYAINETQTSGRPEFLHAAQRGGPAGKILAQFAGPRFVRWGMEVEALHRAFVMGDKGAKRKLMSRMVALHLMCGPMLALAGALGRALFGTKEWDSDEESQRIAYEAAKNMVEGPMSGWFVIGGILDAGVVSATSPEGYHGMARYEVPLFSKLGNLTQASSKIFKDIAGCMEWGDWDGEEIDDVKKQMLRIFDMLFPVTKNARGVMVRTGAVEPDE